MVSSVVAAFLYLRIMVSAWMADPPTDGEALEPVRVPFVSRAWRSPPPSPSRSLVGIFPEWLLDAAETTTTEFAR